MHKARAPVYEECRFRSWSLACEEQQVWMYMAQVYLQSVKIYHEFFLTCMQLNHHRLGPGRRCPTYKFYQILSISIYTSESSSVSFPWQVTHLPYRVLEAVHQGETSSFQFVEHRDSGIAVWYWFGYSAVSVRCAFLVRVTVRGVGSRFLGLRRKSLVSECVVPISYSSQSRFQRSHSSQSRW